jgi:hypothetical protein
MAMMLRRSLYLDRILPFVGKDVIKIVTGIRRSGKSTILQQVREELIAGGVAPERTLAVNLESYGNRRLKDPDELYRHIRETLQLDTVSAPSYLFLDEIQEVPGWEQLVCGLQTESPIDIYLTGSNAHFLSKEFATYLSGRYVEFDVYPFSFREFHELRHQDGFTSPLAEAFDCYCTLGGFPFLGHLGYDPAPCREYLLSIYDTVVLKDIVERAAIADASLLGELLPFLMANVGHVFSDRSIARMLEGENVRMAPATIGKYVQAACDAQLLLRANREDAMSRKVFKSQEKYYLADHGLREAVYGNNGRNIDQVLENIVYLELRRHGWHVTVGDVADGLQPGGNSLEIDFIATRGSDRRYIQVCYVLTDERTVEREFRPLEALRVDYPKYVLSLDTVERGRNGIPQIYLPTFLMQAEKYLG